MVMKNKVSGNDTLNNESKTKISEVSRKTKETNIQVGLNVVGSQQVQIDTGIGFLDHMLEQLAFHANWNLSIKVKGDLEVDDHHTVEDIAICLGRALQECWRNKGTTQRYGQRLLPMDEALIMCAVDLSGRGIYVGELEFTRETIGNISTEMFEHFFNTFAINAAMALHLKPLYFRNNHHLIEGCFKSVAYALKDALSETSSCNTTKGSL